MEKMRLVVLVDIPHETRHQRKVEREFNEALYKAGFTLLQQGVFTRITDGRQSASIYAQHLCKCRPEFGTVRVFVLTEKQFEESVLLTQNETPQEIEIGAQLDIFL